MISRYFRFLVIGIFAVGLSFCCPGPMIGPAWAEDENITEAGDWLQIILPAVAIGSTFFAGGEDSKHWDKEGTAQSIKAVGGALGTTTVAKGIVGKMRPNEANELSYPSGHTTAAFAGAGFIDTRYGHAWGIPALLTAGFVGYSRVQSSNHFADDVTAGMSIGLMSNWLFVTPQSQSRTLALLPMPMENGTGVQLVYTTGTGKGPESKQFKKSERACRYEFGFGPAFLIKNEVTSPSDGGTKFDLANFNKDQDPTSTAVVIFDYYLNDRNTLTLNWAPFEARDNGTFSSPVSFAGQTFPANTTVKSAWVHYSLTAGWSYNLIPSDPWDLNLGGGLGYQYTEVDLLTEDETISGSVSDSVILPYIHASGDYRINKRWSAGVCMDGISLSDDKMFTGIVHADYQISRQWDFSLGYEYYARDIETSKLRNKVQYHGPYMSISFSWLR